MNYNIRVYLFPDTSDYIRNNDYLLDEIEVNTNTYIYYNRLEFNSFFEIEGLFENVHRARIMLQEIEKEIYKQCNLQS
jgi:hypothetical protein